MELIREHLIYKDVPIEICFGTLKSQEQYECIRLLLATRTKDVSICLHEITNPYILQLIKTLSVKQTHCLEKSVYQKEFTL